VVARFTESVTEGEMGVSQMGRGVSQMGRRQQNALMALAIPMIAGAALILASPAAAATTCTNVERGTQAPDKLVGTTGGDLLQAGGGSDDVNGLAGSDCLAGGAKSDLLKPGAGSDRVKGGRGSDKLITRDGFRDIVGCGHGRDKVVADWRDRVKRSCEGIARHGKRQGSPSPPAANCALDPATMTAPGCTLMSSDTASSANPERLWGRIECASDSRASEVTSGGDPYPTAGGAPQGNSASRRLTVLDGDDFWGERCELGRNESRYGSDGGDGTFQLYREGERRITIVDFRLPGDFQTDARPFQTLLQMKQTQPSDNGSCPPVLSLEVRNGEWWLQHAETPGACGESLTETLWKAPAVTGVWVRMALDVTYSQHSNKGSVKLYLDRNGDGDSLDADERSPTITTHTLKYETPDPDGKANDTDGLGPGDSIPSHLRVGLYHDPSIACPAPAGCSVQMDNVQVVRP
jgi:Ca2+-binding RTX toxin-like protein